MVLLTMTPSIVEALQSLAVDSTSLDESSTDESTDQTILSLQDPAVGKPISHSQIMKLSRDLKLSKPPHTSSLESLLRGSKVYVPPPAPKAEPTPEYKALMARLRRDEEARSYERMLNSNAHHQPETFYDRFPHASAKAFAAVNQPVSADDTGDDDEITFQDIQRQVLLLMNFLVSIFGVGGTLWVLAKWWSLPARLFLAMGGAIVVAIVEASVYSIYVWKLDDAKQKEKTVKEVKQVVETWVVGDNKSEEEQDDGKTILLESKEEDIPGVRKRATAVPKAD